QEFGEKVFSTDGEIFSYKLCDAKVTALSRLSTKDSRESLLFKNNSAYSSSSTNNVSEFSNDLCQWMVSSNISIEKLHNQHFRTFLETYTCHPIPSDRR
ncbi:hypothetical protein B7P43_G18967, partial [Cryptotermes secundus]